MSFGDRTDFETFLLEDVMLTLGNVRSSLAWLAGGTPALNAEGRSWQQAAVERLDFQLSQLEDRARALHVGLKSRRHTTGGGSEVVFRSRRSVRHTSTRRAQ